MGKKCIKTKDGLCPSFVLEVTPGFEPGNQGFADPCLTTWLCHHAYSIICELFRKVYTFLKKTQNFFPSDFCLLDRSKTAQQKTFT